MANSPAEFVRAANPLVVQGEALLAQGVGYVLETEPAIWASWERSVEDYIGEVTRLLDDGAPKAWLELRDQLALPINEDLREVQMDGHTYIAGRGHRSRKRLSRTLAVLRKAISNA